MYGKDNEKNGSEKGKKENSKEIMEEARKTVESY